MQLTSNYGFKKPDGTETVDIDDLNHNADVMDTQLKNLNDGKLDDVYGTATGTNTLVMSATNVKSYQVGMLVAFKNTTANTGASTLNINGLGAKPIIKNGGTPLTSGNLKAGGVYTVRYDGSNFILQGEGGEYGTAVASDVLTGKTIGTESGLVNGTMPNRGAVTAAINAGAEYAIPAGYHNGNGKVTGNTLAIQTPADVTAAQILAGKTAWVNGAKVTGTIPNYSRITLGEYYVQALSALADSSGSLVIEPPTGYYEAGKNSVGFGSIIARDVDLIAANIIAGKNIFGVNGTANPVSLGGLRLAKGTAVSVNGELTVSGLAFKPLIILASPYNYTTRAGVFYMDRSLFITTHGMAAYSATTSLFEAADSEAVILSNGFKVRANLDKTDGLVCDWIALG